MNKVKNPIKILYLVTDLKLGGAQTVLVNVIEEINLEKFSPIVACLFGGNQPIAGKIKSLGISVYDLEMNQFWRIDALYRLFKLIKQDRIQIIHASLFHASLAARLVGKLAKVPVIISWRHNIDHGSRFRDLINKFTSPFEDAVTAVSSQVKRVEIDTTDVQPEKVEIIHNGIPIRKFSQIDNNVREKFRIHHNISNDELLIGFVGRFNPAKGIDILLKAFSLVLRGDSAQSRLLLVGEGSLTNQMKTHASTLGIDNRVIFWGRSKEIPEILAALDLIVLPSISEGLPMVLLEAMTAGIPVVATIVGGIPEVIVDGETGILVPPSDPIALADAIKVMLNNPDLRARIGRSGRDRVVENFSIERTVRKFEDLYIRLFEKKGIIV